MSEDLTRNLLRDLIEDVRENGSSHGIVRLPGPGTSPDWVNISLARFQSYRGRTTAALLEELEDLAQGASGIEYHVFDTLVRIYVA